MYYPNLKAEMARKNVMNKDIAELLGVRLATITDKMAVRSDFTVSEAIKIMEFLGVDMPIKELFERAE